MSILPTLWEILINTVENVIYVLLFMQCLVLHKYLEQHKTAILLAFATVETVLTCLCNFQEAASIFTQLLLFIVDYIVILYVFEDSLSKKLFVAIFPSFISILADKFTFTIGDLLGPSSLTNFIYEGYHRYYSTLIYLCFCILLSLLFGKLFQRDIYLTSSLRIATYVSIVLSIVFTNFFLDILLSAEYFPADVRHQVQLLSIGFILIISILIILIQKTGRICKQNLSLENQIHQEQVSKVQLDLSKQAMDTIRSWKHDYKNHLITMTNLLQEEKYLELSDYLHQLQNQAPEYLSNVSSGNSSIDAIVTNKMQLAKQADIRFQYSIILPMVCPLTDLELTAILGNLLDNSLEACHKIMLEGQEQPPYVKLLIKPFRDMMQIQVVNSSDGNYRFAQNGILCTTKEDAAFHGYGLKRMAGIVEQANGMMNIQPEKETFTVNILIPISEKKDKKSA